MTLKKVSATVVITLSSFLSFPSYAWNTNDASKLDTKIKLHMWFDVSAPTENETEYFNKAADTMDRLAANNAVLEAIAQRDNVQIFTNQYISSQIKEQFTSNKISDSFFYDIETAQIFSLVKMTMNYCRLSGDCVAGKAPAQIVQWAQSTTAKGRARERSANAIDRDDLIAGTVLGAAAVVYFGGLNEMFKSSSNISNYEIPAQSSRCESGDLCYEILQSQTMKLDIQCTRGPYTGQKMSVCGNESGKWATGCGATDIFAHHESSSDDAANSACGLGSWW